MDYLRYYLGTLVVGVSILGLALGDGWVWLGIGTFPVLMALDLVLPQDHRKRNVRSAALADVPLYLHIPLMFTLWTLALLRLGQWANGVDNPADAVTGLQVAGIVLTLGWVGVVPNVPVTHEIWHRRHWFPVACAKLLNVFFLDPNRDIAHNLTHHIDLCTEADSDTPRRGQTIYGFMWTASRGAYADAVKTSLESIRKRDLSFFSLRNSLYIEVGVLGTLLGLTFWAAGLSGVGIVLLTLLFSKTLAEGLNYLQHYGLVRVMGAPIRSHHAWNHLGRVIRPLGMEITNHMNHHFDSRHKYHELEPVTEGPQMPSGLMCFVAALIPPVWTKLIAQPKLRHWDQHFASPQEQVLAMEANRRAGWPQWLDLKPSDAPADARVEA